jgi:hypothetical protein
MLLATDIKRRIQICGSGSVPVPKMLRIHNTDIKPLFWFGLLAEVCSKTCKTTVPGGENLHRLVCVEKEATQLSAEVPLGFLPRHTISAARQLDRHKT